MRIRERLIVYPLLAVIALAAFLDLGPTRAQGPARFSQLIIADSGGRTRMTMLMTLVGPALILADENGKMRAVLELGRGGEPSLVFLDRKGNRIWSAP